jgi:AcrR family transcriptional regulator
MSKKLKGRGVSRLQWLDAGLDALAHSPVAGIRIEKLARALGIGKAGFYWHFENRLYYIDKIL